MKLKKIIFAVILLAFNFSVLSAFEWGGLVDDNTKFTAAENPAFSQSNGIYLWLKTPVTQDGHFYVSAEGLYKYKLNLTGLNKTPKSDFINILDVDLLKLNGFWEAFKGEMNLNAGRYFFSDNTGAVFSQVSDGIGLSYANNFIGFSLYGGYTGLLNSLNVSMTEKNPDANNKQIYNLCAAFVPVSVKFSLLDLGGFSASVEGDYFISMNEKIKNRAYASLNVAGPISTIGMVNLNFAAGTYEFKELMLFSNVDVNFFAGNLFLIGFGGEYGSGTKTEKKLAAFSPVTSRTIYSGLRPVKYDYIAPRLSGTFVMNNLYAKLTEKTVIVPDDETKLFGIDSVLDIKYNIFSDLQVGANGTLYFDFGDKKYNNISFSINAALEF